MHDTKGAQAMEVLKLPKRKQKELAQLLDETDLSGIISAATLLLIA
jgi:hypothetical protein